MYMHKKSSAGAECGDYERAVLLLLGAHYAVDITQQVQQAVGFFEIKIAYTFSTLGDRISLCKRPNEDLG